MEKRNPLTLTLDQPFVAGTDDFSPFYNRLHKLNCAIILYCRAGRGTMAIDLKKYEITVNTQVVLLPGAVISLDEKSDDFRVSFFASHIEMFREACIRFEPSFFHFIKEKPCYTLPSEFTAPINGLLHATSAIYADTDHRFRNQIARNPCKVSCLMYTTKYTAFSPIKRLRAAVVRTNFFISSLLWCTNIAVRNGMSFSMQANSVFLLST